jgi:hypothetical protein
MHLILMFFVVDLMLVFILGVLVALLGGMLAFWSVHRAWLERLVTAVRRSLVLLFLLVLVIVVTMTAVIAILPLVVVTMIPVALPAVATITPLTLFSDMADVFVVLLPEHMTHLTSHRMLDLMLAFLCKGTIYYFQIKNVLEVLCDRLKHLVTKRLPTLNILCAILRVEGHIEPLEY